MGLRERKRRETYLRIEDEATRLFLEKSYDTVTLEEICEAAVVSRRTFFNYFQSKDHVAIGDVPTSLSDEELNNLANLQLEPGQKLSQFLLDYLTKRRIRHAEKMMAGSINPALSEIISERRAEILRRNPTLGLSNLNGFEQMRRGLVDAVVRNLDKFPAHRNLTNVTAREEASLTVVAIVTTQWTEAMFLTEVPAGYSAQQSLDRTVDNFAQMFATLSNRE